MFFYHKNNADKASGILGAKKKKSVETRLISGIRVL